MKKLFAILTSIVFIAVFLTSCNKDESTPTSGNTTNQGATTTFTSTPNINIAPNGWTNDSLNANITSGMYSQNVSFIKLNLNNLEGIQVSNLRFALFHNGVEVFVVDTPLTVPSTGNMINTVLSDSGEVNISNGNYPFTATFRPQRPLSDFINSEAGGYWTLRIYNSGNLRTGVIKSWGITISYSPSLQTPTFTGAYLPMRDDIHKFKLCDTNNVFPGEGGANVTWDFTNIVPQPTIYSDEYVEPIISPMSWHFPQSNLAVRNIDLNGNRFDFIRSEPNPGTFKFYGNADSNMNGLKIMQFQPWLWTFRGNPITYNYFNIDSGLTYFSEPGITRNGKYMDTVRSDGWGTIMLPNGLIYKNVLRMINGIAGIDTTNSSIVSYTLNRIYSWYATGYKFPVFRIQTYYRYSQSQGSGFKEVIFTTQNVPINKK